MSELSSYAFDEVAVTLDGTTIEDFTEGDDVVSITPRVSHYDMKIGADGAGVIAKNSDRSATVVLKLLQTSPSNAKLTDKYSAQEAGIIVPFPFGVRDMNGKDLAFSRNAIVVGPAPMVRGSAPNGVEWTLILHDCSILNLGIGD